MKASTVFLIVLEFSIAATADGYSAFELGCVEHQINWTLPFYYIFVFYDLGVCHGLLLVPICLQEGGGKLLP